MTPDANRTLDRIKEMAEHSRDSADCANRLLQFIESGDSDLIRNLTNPPGSDFPHAMALALWQLPSWGTVEEASLRFVASLAFLRGGPGNQGYEAPLESVFHYLYSDTPQTALPGGFDLFGTLTDIGFEPRALIALQATTKQEPAFATWSAAPLRDDNGKPAGLCPFEDFLWNLSDDELPALMDDVPENHFLLEAMAPVRPAVAKEWLSLKIRTGGLTSVGPEQMTALLRSSDAFDSDAEKYVRDTSDPAHGAAVVWQLGDLRPERHAALCAEYFSRPEIAAFPKIMELLCRTQPDFALKQLMAVIQEGFYKLHCPPGVNFMRSDPPQCYRTGFRLAATRLEGPGLAVFNALIADGNAFALAQAIQELVPEIPPEKASSLDDLLSAICFHPNAANLSLTVSMLQFVREHLPLALSGVWWRLLDGEIPLPSGELFPFMAQGLPGGPAGVEPARRLAVTALCENLGEKALPQAGIRLDHKKKQIRLGAVSLLSGLGTETAVTMLKERLASEEDTAVRDAIHAALRLHGIRLEFPGPDPKKVRQALHEMEPGFSKRLIKAKLPPGDWWRIDGLSGLKALDGSPVSVKAAEFLIFEHTRLKTVEPAPDALALIACLDNRSAADFAAALLSAWLREGGDSKHRWVLALAGTLGDSRVISALLPWIPKWCESARHKLAEYAAQAISLLGSNEALMVLDSLATRYRSKFRNVGAAAAKAFQAAADARGMSPDELGDLVVPAFDFDEDGQRRFEWEGGAAVAELTMDLKLEWSDPESDKSLKTLPSGAPEAMKSEVKELGKLLRESGKAQALRLEQALVKQRRWPAPAWRELYEKHPLLRAYATRLVWGVYDTDGRLRRTFRRYPNGLLADAAGGLEELPETDVFIGMVHPLELDDAGLAAWRAHLARFKVTAPFLQLDRPVERLDPAHHNRRELTLAEGQELSYGTFRSRAEKLGWTRGSVIDGGGISGYYKLFAGAGVEVTLPTDGIYMGADPMEKLSLGIARFCQAESVKRGSYIYDDPKAGDPRILTFGKVPPIVYSETVGDLKAITARKPDTDS